MLCAMRGRGVEEVCDVGIRVCGRDKDLPQATAGRVLLAEGQAYQIEGDNL